MTKFKRKTIDDIIKVEGLYSNDIHDSGKKTMYGITERTARAYGYKGKMRDLPYKKAFEIYSRIYWDKLRLNDIEKIAPRTAEKLADVGINAGTSRAGKFIQRSLNALNYKNRYGADLKIDGQIGEKTIKMLQGFVSHRGKSGDNNLAKMIRSLQGHHYISIANKHKKNKRFTFGWIDNRIS